MQFQNRSDWKTEELTGQIMMKFMLRKRLNPALTAKVQCAKYFCAVKKKMCMLHSVSWVCHLTWVTSSFKIYSLHQRVVIFICCKWGKIKGLIVKNCNNQAHETDNCFWIELIALNDTCFVYVLGNPYSPANNFFLGNFTMKENFLIICCPGLNL